MRCLSVSERKNVNSYPPYQPYAVVIPAGLGAIVGLYLFFRGFSLLHRSPVAPRATMPRSTAPITVSTSATFTAKGDSLTQHLRREVVRLSPTGDESARAASMTQQGKIAAALLRAGIANPASWSATAESGLAAVKVAERPSNGNSSTHTQLLDPKTAKSLKSAAESPALRMSPRTAANGSDRRPALLIWGGAFLTLVCIYLLAAQLGWL